MPNAWRNGVEQNLHVPFSLSPAHLVVFCSVSLLLLMRPLACLAHWVMLLALTLATLTETLQVLAINRHPSLRDPGMAVADTSLAVTLMALQRRRAGISRPVGFAKSDGCMETNQPGFKK